MSEITDFTTGFWTGWVVTITLLGLGFICFLLYTVFSPSGQRIRSEEEVWDETLSEGNSVPPRWWFLLFLAMIVFSLGYLVLFPGLGSYRGVLEWTQYHQFSEAEKHHGQQYGEVHERWMTASFEELAADGAAMRTAAGLYVDNCSACHGRDGTGQANLFPNLVDGEWQWGGAPEQILASIAGGRQAVMVSQTAALGGEREVGEMADYVLALSGQADPGPAHSESAARFAQVCAACHGPGGNGNAALGAPSLTDDVWLYGGDRDTIIETLALGRNGVMPAQEQRLGEARSRLLAAWIAAGGPSAAPAVAEASGGTLEDY